MGVLTLAVSFGEAADKITILQIKAGKISDPAKLRNITTELEMISKPFFAAVKNVEHFLPAFEELRRINERLWDIEDEIRECERAGDFGPRFIQLARAVYFTNDERARVKKEINLLLGSAIVEEKSYAGYGARGEPESKRAAS